MKQFNVEATVLRKVSTFVVNLFITHKIISKLRDDYLIYTIENSNQHMSGWPSGLRRQT